MPELNRRRSIGALLQFTALVHPFGRALLAAVEVQPLAAQVKRLVDAMEYLGEPFSETERERLDAAANLSDQTRAIEEIQRVLDARCLFLVGINPESRISVERGAAPARLVEQGWRAFLIKVRNEAGVTGELNLESPQARPVFRPSTGEPSARSRCIQRMSQTDGSNWSPTYKNPSSHSFPCWSSNTASHSSTAAIAVAARRRLARSPGQEPKTLDSGIARPFCSK